MNKGDPLDLQSQNKWAVNWVENEVWMTFMSCVITNKQTNSYISPLLFLIPILNFWLIFRNKLDPHDLQSWIKWAVNWEENKGWITFMSCVPTNKQQPYLTTFILDIHTKVLKNKTGINSILLTSNHELNELWIE